MVIKEVILQQYLFLFKYKIVSVFSQVLLKFPKSSIATILTTNAVGGIWMDC